jgi:hypothetical protein
MRATWKVNPNKTIYETECTRMAAVRFTAGGQYGTCGGILSGRRKKMVRGSPAVRQNGGCINRLPHWIKACAPWRAIDYSPARHLKLCAPCSKKLTRQRFSGTVGDGLDAQSRADDRHEFFG